MMIVQFFVSMIATLSFAALFNAPKKQLFFCGLTGAIGWIVYLICVNQGMGVAPASLIATFVLTILSRILSVVRKNPVTMFLVPGIFPLVPGAGIYYTAYYMIMNEMKEFSQKGIETFLIAGAIALGIVFGLAIPQAVFNTLKKEDHNQ